MTQQMACNPSQRRSAPQAAGSVSCAAHYGASARNTAGRVRAGLVRGGSFCFLQDSNTLPRPLSRRKNGRPPGPTPLPSCGSSPALVGFEMAPRSTKGSIKRSKRPRRSDVDLPISCGRGGTLFYSIHTNNNSNNVESTPGTGAPQQSSDSRTKHNSRTPNTSPWRVRDACLRALASRAHRMHIAMAGCARENRD